MMGPLSRLCCFSKNVSGHNFYFNHCRTSPHLTRIPARLIWMSLQFLIWVTCQSPHRPRPLRVSLQVLQHLLRAPGSRPLPLNLRPHPPNQRPRPPNQRPHQLNQRLHKGAILMNWFTVKDKLSQMCYLIKVVTQDLNPIVIPNPSCQSHRLANQVFHRI